MKRRDFLLQVATTAGALPWLSVALPAAADAAAAAAATVGSGQATASWQPVAWLDFLADGRIHVAVAKSEMGQGVLTALPMLVAEELDVALDQLHIDLAPGAVAFRDARGNQTTGYSSSISSSFLPMRKLAAAARLALLDAAAARWSVPVAALQTERGVVFELPPATRRVSYAELAPAARLRPLHSDPPLRPRSSWRTLGTTPQRIDTAAKTDGSLQFGIDIQVPGMLVGVVARAPALGATLQAFDARRALRMPGVQQVLRISSGVVVLANNFWAARRGREALTLHWQRDPEALSSADHERLLAAKLDQPGVLARRAGQPEDLERDGSGHWLHADYQTPFLAHAAMEPLACTASVQADRCDIWVGTQAPSRAQNFGAEISGLPLDRVFVHTLPIGGAFGRRGEWDWVVEALEASKAAGRPVKLIWSREDDLQHDFYRPATANRLAARLSGDGQLQLLTHRIAGPSVARRRSVEMLLRGHDFLLTQGSDDMEYAIPQFRVDYHETDLGVPVGFWRSVGHSHNGFVVESFIDEIAHAAATDPLQLRLGLLTHEPRMQAVLRTAAEAAGWGTQLPAGSARGIACMKSYGTYVAQVAEVRVDGAQIAVQRVLCAVDAGVVVHPGIVEQQMHSGIVFALSAALGGEILFERGAVQQSNYHDYPPLRLPEMPQIDVRIIASDAAPGGCGEPAAPVIAPAVANAVFAATGQRLRRLPLRLG